MAVVRQPYKRPTPAKHLLRSSVSHPPPVFVHYFFKMNLDENLESNIANQRIIKIEWSNLVHLDIVYLYVSLVRVNSKDVEVSHQY